MDWIGSILTPSASEKGYWVFVKDRRKQDRRKAHKSIRTAMKEWQRYGGRDNKRRGERRAG